jgi:FkbM family methyltransferase
MSKMRELIKRELLRRDIIFSRPPGQFIVTEHKLAKARDRGLKLNMVVDGGAANGEWAELLKHIYPATKVLCVEPRADVQVELHRRAAMLDGISVAQTLLGAQDGTVDFFEEQRRSSALKNATGQEWGKKVTAPMTTLDALITKMQLPDPDLIKLDLQGYELECLKGATRCLAHAEAVLLEVSFIPIQQGMPLIGDVVPFMSQHGFQVYDITALWHRPLDGAMAQGDFLFIANRSKLLADSRWHRDE